MESLAVIDNLTWPTYRCTLTNESSLNIDTIDIWSITHTSDGPARVSIELTYHYDYIYENLSKGISGKLIVERCISKLFDIDLEEFIRLFNIFVYPENAEYHCKQLKLKINGNSEFYLFICDLVSQGNRLSYLNVWNDVIMEKMKKISYRLNYKLPTISTSIEKIIRGYANNYFAVAVHIIADVANLPEYDEVVDVLQMWRILPEYDDVADV